MAKINKRMVARIALYSTAAVAAFFIYARGNVPVETDTEYCERTGRVKIDDRFFKYDVYENGEMKTIADMLSRGCKGDAYCEIDRAYQYVLKIPYQESSTNRNPSEVINQQRGDCDEKSYLLATLLLQQGHRCVFVTTADHGFIAVHFEKDDATMPHPLSYLTVDGKKYYFAEATFTTGYVGQPNGVSQDEIDAVFDMVGRKEIPIDTVRFNLGRS